MPFFYNIPSHITRLCLGETFWERIADLQCFYEFIAGTTSVIKARKYSTLRIISFSFQERLLAFINRLTAICKWSFIHRKQHNGRKFWGRRNHLRKCCQPVAYFVNFRQWRKAHEGLTENLTFGSFLFLPSLRPAPPPPHHLPHFTACLPRMIATMHRIGTSVTQILKSIDR